MNNVLNICWYHLEVDGQTCVRCQTTHRALVDAISHLKPQLHRGGWQVRIEEVLLLPDQIGQSNRCDFNGKPIEKIIDIRIGMSECPSCSSLTGNSECCRSIEYQGKSYDEIPFEAFIEAIRKTTSLSAFGPVINL